MDDFDIKWNDEQILGNLAEPFYQGNEVLGRSFQNEITAKKWDWPGETDRKSGETATEKRDIVDLGDLRRSYEGERVPPTADGSVEYLHSWNVDHAMAAHEGAKLSNGTTLPSRKWTKEPLEKGVLESSFEKLAKAELEKLE